MVQWLGLCTFTTKGSDSIPGWGTKIPQTVQGSQGKKRKNAPILINTLLVNFIFCFRLTPR